MKRVNVRIPDETHTRAKVIAVLTGKTLSQYLETAVQQAVQKDKHVLEKIKK
ncbi:MAG: hypothetical protein OXR66_05095 [Candidatus Woesearchaeota archaeon]|nr:hypothetical protein [Candidatus Woesearchaeota archaeon]